MKIATCTITRLGNKYLREYIEYYKSIGVDKMYFYDNNRPNEEKVADEIGDYAENGFVEIIDWGNKTGKVQELAYQDCYDKYGKEFDWIGMIDDDEYVTIKSGESLKNFLSKEIFFNKNGVCFPMLNYCDSDIIINESNKRLNVYTQLAFLDNIWTASFYKTFVRGNLNVRYLELRDENNNVIFGCCCHVPIVDGIIGNNFVDCDGNLLVEDKANGLDITFNQYAVSNAFLKHIPTGCIDDFIKMKRRRGWPDTGSNMNNKFNYDYFCQYNKSTEEKLHYYLEMTKNFYE